MSLRITIPLVSIPQSLQDHENDELFISMVDDTTQREVAIPAVYILGKNGWVLLPIFVVILFELTYTVGILYTTYMWIQILRGQCCLLWGPWHVQKDVCRGSWQAWRQHWFASRQEKPSSLPRTGPGENKHNFVQFENNLFPSGEDKARERRENWQEGKIVLEWAPVFLQNKHINFIWRQSPWLSELQHSHGICGRATTNWKLIYNLLRQTTFKTTISLTRKLHFRKVTRTWFWNRWPSCLTSNGHVYRIANGFSGLFFYDV